MFLLLTETGLTTWQIVICFVVVVAIAFIFVLIKDKINKKKASTGEDRARVWGILQKALPEEADLTKAYACWEWSTYQGRTRTTTYWYYGVAFNEDHLYIAPLSCKSGNVESSASYVIRKEDLGMMNSKQGANWVELYDKNGKEIVSLSVFAENLKDDKYHPFNLLQKEEADKFVEWKDKWMESVNAANGVEVTGKMKKPLKKR
ncbi:MAG: hypothetical protein J6D37_03590 [Clostridia bacterium]|nr:hypothetical protein [Clostridia bacterium]